MQKSQTISEIAKALILFQVKMGEVYKDAKNPFFKSSYATLSTIQESIKEPLIESGLTVCQFPTGDHGLTTLILHESGEFLMSEYTMTPVKNDPQGIGSCITYQKRYALVSALNLNVQDEDDDGNKASYGNDKPQDKPWLNKGKVFDAAVTKLKSGATTIEKIKSAYKLSKEIETELLKAIPSTKTKSNIIQNFNEDEINFLKNQQH
jgi:hypothetical protein